jgi:hypothetical protein
VTAVRLSDTKRLEEAMKVTERAAPYAERLLDDSELQRDLREAIAALRGGLKRAEKKGRKPARLAGDRKFKQSLERAGASLKDASARFRGEPPKSHRGRKILIGVVAVAGLALAARKIFTDEGVSTAQEFNRPS